MKKEKNNKASADSRLLFFNALREKFRRPLLPEPPPLPVREPVERQMGLAEYISARRRR